MVRGWVGVGCALLLAGCGQALLPEPDANQAVAYEKASDPARVTPALEPLAPSDLDGVVDPGKGCDLSVDGELLLAAGIDGGGAVKWRGQIVRVRHAGGDLARAGRFIAPGGDPTIDVDPPEGEGEVAGEGVTSWRVVARVASPDDDAEPPPLAAVWSCES